MASWFVYIYEQKHKQEPWFGKTNHLRFASLKTHTQDF